MTQAQADMTYFREITHHMSSYYIGFLHETQSWTQDPRDHCVSRLQVTHSPSRKLSTENLKKKDLSLDQKRIRFYIYISMFI